MKILIVEDDKDLREITTTSLEKERYVVSQAPDYRTALQKIEDQVPMSDEIHNIINFIKNSKGIVK